MDDEDERDERLSMLKMETCGFLGPEPAGNLPGDQLQAWHLALSRNLSLPSLLLVYIASPSVAPPLLYRGSGRACL